MADDLLWRPASIADSLPADGRRRSEDQELRGLRQRQLRGHADRPPVGRPSLHARKEGLFPDRRRPSLNQRCSLDVYARSRRKRQLGRLVADGQHRLAVRPKTSWSTRERRRASSRAASTAAPIRRRNRPNMIRKRSGRMKPAFKSRIADQLTLNAAVFHNNYKDFQARCR